MRKTTAFLTAALGLLFLLTQPVWAVDFQIAGVPTQAEVGESFVVTATYSTTGTGPYYLRPAFYESGSYSYFGCLLVGSSWVCPENANEPTSFFEIQMPSSGVWLGQIEVKSDQGDGEYLFKLIGYTAGGTKTADSNSLPITIIPIVTPTPIPSPTSTPELATGTVKINEAKDNEGEILSQAKIYLNDEYLHHYCPETLTFCPTCTDGGVDLDFGSFQLRVEKTGYEVWEEGFEISSAGYLEFNPILTCLEPTPTKTPTPTPSPTPTPTPTPKTSAEPKPTISPEADEPIPFVLGAEDDASPEVKKSKKNKSENLPGWLGLVFIGGGSAFLMSAFQLMRSERSF